MNQGTLSDDVSDYCTASSATTTASDNVQKGANPGHFWFIFCSFQTAGFELRSSEYKASTLTTIPPLTALAVTRVTPNEFASCQI